MTIFDYDDYKEWVRGTIGAMSKGGRGQLKRIADHLNTSPTIVTQVFNGDRELTPEQGLLLADFFALSKMETRFLILLVNFSRAASHRYSQSLKEEIEELRLSSREISSRVRQSNKLSEEVKSIFYSNWYYLAVWSLTAVEGFNNLETITTRLGLNKKKAREAIEFLLKHSFIIEDEGQNLRVGPTMIHLDSTSSQIPRHHQNWRIKAFAKYENPKIDDIFYTAAVTLSEKDVQRVRENVLQFISQNVEIIKDSASEKLCCLCLDWFEV